MEEERHPWYKSPDIDLVLSRLEKWRKVRRSGEKIPIELWDAAIELTEKYPINRVAYILGLEGAKFRSLINKKKGISASVDSAVKESFIELKVSEPSNRIMGVFESPCLLELYKSDGSHVKVYSSAGGLIDITRICESFFQS